MKFRINKKLTRSFYGNAILFIVLLFSGLFMVLPLVYTIVTAFKPLNEIMIFPPRFFVSNPTFDNFIQMMKLAQEMWVPFSRYLFNSLFVTLGGTAAYVLIASLAAYPIALYKFKALKYIYSLLVWAILFRPEVTGVSQYVIMSKLSIVDTYLAVILPVLAGSFGVFLMCQFISTIPEALLEAAEIDGASEYRKYWSIVMPTVKPAWLTLIIFTFMQYWNINGIQYIYSENLKMLPTILQQITTGGIARAGAASAVAFILMLPPIMIFVATQSSIIETMSHSGIK